MILIKKHSKLISGLLAATMLFSLPAAPIFASSKPAGAQYSAVQLHAAPVKEMKYYKTGDAAIPSISWVTTKTDLVFLPQTAIGDVNAVVKDADGVYWIGTQNGLQRVDFKESDERDVVQYMAGPRYLYGGDDNVTGVASDNAGGVWVRTASGVTHISMPKKTLLQRTSVYEGLIKNVHDRRGMVNGTNFTFTDSSQTAVDYNSATGSFSSTPSTSDNDGLWTAMYAMGEIFRYKTLKDEYGSTPTTAQQGEITAAKKAAVRATKAVILLDYISGRGNGFPARSYMLTREAGAQTVGGTVYGRQSENGLWFQNIVGPDAVNPNGIIPSLRRTDKTPIGYSIARVTSDSMKKSGSVIYSGGEFDVTGYNGLGLSTEAINALNETRPDGQKLGKDINTIVKNVNGVDVFQVLPVITNATNGKKAKDDTTTSVNNKPLFQLTAPIYEQIPTIFNDLFPEDVIVDGHIDQNQIVYKADTSADEISGHYGLYFTAYKYLTEGSTDPDLIALKSIIAQTTDRMTNLILADNHYYIEDATGRPTSWSRWMAKYFNDNLAIMEQQPVWANKVGVDANGNDALSWGYEDGPLNVLEIMASLKTAIFVTAEEYPQDQAKFKAAYDLAFDSEYSKSEPFVDGKGYINVALEYIDRRLVRQATNAYDIKNKVVTKDEPQYTKDAEEVSNINATLHNDWTQYINYSDEELGWFPVFELIMLEQDPTRHAQIVAAFDQWYSNEVREENPFYTFLYQLAHPEKTNVDINSAVRYLYRMPEHMVNFAIKYDRQDVFYIENGDRDKTFKQTNYVLPTDERRIQKNNGNPFSVDNGTYSTNSNYNYNGGSMEAGTTFTLPYWLGRYFGIIKEAE